MSLNGHVVLREDPTLVGEVIESTTTDFVAQACQLDEAPPFGTFVQVTGDDGITVYAVVAQVQTAGIDPGARPIMRGHGEVRDDLIYVENPDLPHVLRTTFRALVVGFAQHGAYRQFLPARPPRLHYSVSTCGPLEVRQFTDAGLDYLGALLSSADAPSDELVAANIRIVAGQRGEDFTRDAGRELAQLLRGDYARLTAILRRCVSSLEALTP
jgi:hypothetical protein